MLTLFGNLDSGNVHKVQMVLRFRDLAFQRVDVRQDRGQPRDPRYLRLCPTGKVPAVLLEDGDLLSESGALLFYFARDTRLWPATSREQAEVLRWMFFEQYSHEPALAVLRYLKLFADPAELSASRIEELETKSQFVLDVLNRQLLTCDWIATCGPTIADFALYPYTRLSEEIGLDIARWPALSGWLGRIKKNWKFQACSKRSRGSAVIRNSTAC